MGAGMRRMMRVKMVTSIERTEFCYTFVAYGFSTNFFSCPIYGKESRGWMNMAAPGPGCRSAEF